MAKYDPLREHLVVSGKSTISMTFAQISALIDGLPKSAYEHQAWWANEIDGQHVQAHSWLNAGFVVEFFDQNSETVRFVKQ
jgi:hypothetical protein